MTPSGALNSNSTPSAAEARAEAESKATAESLIPQFQLTRVLNSDQGSRRVLILGKILGQNGILSLERAAFPTSADAIASFLHTLTNTVNLGANDIYRWYLSNNTSTDQPDLKLNLIWPCSDAHIRKYTVQETRYVTETPEVYARYVRPWIERTQRGKERLEWIWNILDGITEQDDIVYRSEGFGKHSRIDNGGGKGESEGFLLLPDLNWDRRTVTSLHLLAIVERRDVWSLRDLKRKHVPWLKKMREEIVRSAAEQGTKMVREEQAKAKAKAEAEAEAKLKTPAPTSTNAENTSNGDSTSATNTAASMRTEGLGETPRKDEVEEDQIKCYIHYQPTYYHFHVHVVHVMLEAEGHTQSIGKAFSLDNLISQLEHMDGGDDAGMDQVDLSYFMGEQSELWRKCFAKLKQGEEVDLN